VNADPSRAENSVHLGVKGLLIPDVLDYVRGKDNIKGRVWKRDTAAVVIHDIRQPVGAVRVLDANCRSADSAEHQELCASTAPDFREVLRGKNVAVTRDDASNLLSAQRVHKLLCGQHISGVLAREKRRLDNIGPARSRTCLAFTATV
jgi:hypothetical protein